MFVLASDRPVEIRSVHRTGFRQHDMKHNDQPVMILREVTRQDWINCCVELYGVCVAPNNREVIHFYEITTD